MVDLLNHIGLALAQVLTVAVIAWGLFGLTSVFAVILMQDSNPDLLLNAGVQL